MGMQTCPSCNQEEVVLAVHTGDEELLPFLAQHGIGEAHGVCNNCDWGTCGFD